MFSCKTFINSLLLILINFLIPISFILGFGFLGMVRLLRMVLLEGFDCNINSLGYVYKITSYKLTGILFIYSMSFSFSIYGIIL